MVGLIIECILLGVTAFALLLQGLKATGSYLARALSYHGAEFTLADTQLSPQMRCDFRNDEACQNLMCCMIFSDKTAVPK
jgi:hypothetical protein